MVRVAVKPLRAPRRNPSRSVGAVLINRGKRRKNRGGKRRSSARRLLSMLRLNRGGSRKHRRGGKRRAHARRRNPVIINRRRRNAGRRHVMRNRRRNAGRRAAPRVMYRANRKRRNTSRRNRVYSVKANRRHKRRNPVIINRRRRNAGRRRNPSTRMRLFRNPSLPMGLGRIPLVGPFLGTMLASAGSAVFGAAAMYPVVHGVTYVERYFPSLRADAAFAVAGFALAGLVGVANKVSGGKIPYAREASVALATAGSAIGAYKMYTGAGGATVAEEKAGMYAGELAGYAGTDAMGWPGDIAVVPMTQQAYGSSREDIAAVQGMYGDSSWADADLGAMGGTFAMIPEERQAALAGPAAWRASFPSPRITGGMLQRARAAGDRPSQHAGQPGHRYGWMIDAIGFERFQKFAALSPAAQEAMIPQLLDEFRQGADTVFASQPVPKQSNYGAQVWAA